MKQLWISTLILILALSACQKNKKSDEVQPVTNTPSDTLVTEQLPDSTIYGISDEFGMSTFTLISDDKDTLYLTRTASDGTDGKIYGDLKEGERYALTTRENNSAIGVLINVTELKKHVKDYTIQNGNLIIDGKVVEIEKLNDKEFKLKK